MTAMSAMVSNKVSKSSVELAAKLPDKLAAKLPTNSVVCLMAPTASGKTALAYELYDTGRFELISVDSALIYRDMTIGTAKPSPQELARYPHHMVDIVNPDQTYSVAQFVAQVDALITDIHERGKLPLLVGGTMMYFNAMFSGLSPVPQTCVNMRASVEAWRQKAGLEALYGYLQTIDPLLGATLKPNDTQRITRAIEVYKQTGKPLSYWQTLPKSAIADNPNRQWLGMAVMPNRAWLHDRIAQRLEMMWTAGFVDEVIELLNTYNLMSDSPALRCVGYRQVVDFLQVIHHPSVAHIPALESVSTNNKNPMFGYDADTLIKLPAYQNMQDKALYATRQLAKRQYTWLRGLLKKYNTPFIPIATGRVKQLNIKRTQAHFPLSSLTWQQDMKFYPVSVNNTYLSTHRVVKKTTLSKELSNKWVFKFDNMTAAKQYIHQRL